MVNDLFATRDRLIEGLKRRNANLREKNRVLRQDLIEAKALLLKAQGSVHDQWTALEIGRFLKNLK